MTDAVTVTLKDDFTFLVSDHSGDLRNGPDGHGMYLRDTRYLSKLELLVNGEKPFSLNYTTDYNIAATFRLSAVHFGLMEHNGQSVPGQVGHAVGIARRRYIEHGLVESLEFTNYYPTEVEVEVTLLVGADFADMFEVRGVPRSTPGHTVSMEMRNGSDGGNDGSLRPGPGGGRGTTILIYTQPISPTRAGDVRTMLFTCDATPVNWEETTTPDSLTGKEMEEIALHYKLNLAPRQPVTMHLRLVPEPDSETHDRRAAHGDVSPPLTFRQQVAKARGVFTEWQRACTRINTDNYALNRILETSILDLRSLMQQEPQGLVVTAGLPWYFTLFGRDSLITALETLVLNPQIAIDTLRALASYQATEVDDWRDSEPGKILHELRRGDMTLASEIPHSPYYGSVDSTLLYMILFVETLKWTGSQALFDELWGSVRRALDWAWSWGDLDGDGYIEYKTRSTRGIRNQGWKDSDESLGGTVGPRPAPPIALVEVQGYYYAALLGVAETLKRYGGAVDEQAKGGLVARLEDQAAHLKEQFNRDFWWEEEGFYVHALDGSKDRVMDVTSNVGHCLWTGIVDESRAPRVVARLMRPDMLSGWGVRTISAENATYNPMSYHNGSVWPHDNAILVAGLRRYGFEVEMQQLATEILEAAVAFPDSRLPELYCGFARGMGVEQESAPAAYPVSCSPQAWAAGAPLLILQALLGIEVSAEGHVSHAKGILPGGVGSIEVRGMRVCNESLDLDFRSDAAAITAGTAAGASAFTPTPGGGAFSQYDGGLAIAGHEPAHDR